MPANPYEQLSAYGKNQRLQAEIPSDNSRDIDAHALLTCASRLNDVKALMQQDSRLKDNLRVYCEAIRTNQRLWTIFQVALTDPENMLPENLKITLLNLSGYVDKTSFRAISKFAPNLIDSLININRIIAAGLSKKPEGQAQSSPDMSQHTPVKSVMTSI